MCSSKKQFLLHEIQHFHYGDYEDPYLLKCKVMLSSRNLPALGKNVLPPYFKTLVFLSGCRASHSRKRYYLLCNMITLMKQVLQTLLHSDLIRGWHFIALNSCHSCKVLWNTVPFANCVELHLRVRCLVWYVNRIYQT